MIHLDTSFLIRALDLGSSEDRKLRSWIGEGETLRMSTVAWAEFLCGPLARSEMELASEIVGHAATSQPITLRSPPVYSMSREGGVGH